MFQRVFNFLPRKELQDAAGVDILGETTVNNISFLPQTVCCDQPSSQKTWIRLVTCD